MQEISTGYGHKDIDITYADNENHHVACVSCKVDPWAHNVQFFDNFLTHFPHPQMRQTFYIILCSPNAIPSKIFQKFTQFRDRMNVNCNLCIETVTMSKLVPQLVNSRNFQFEKSVYPSGWPYLKRVDQIKRVTALSHRIIHIVGHRRVGKTSLVKEARRNKEKDIYLSLFQI